MDKYYGFLESTQIDADDHARLDDQRPWLIERQGDVASIRSTRVTLNLTEVIGAAADDVFADTASREAVRVCGVR